MHADGTWTDIVINDDAAAKPPLLSCLDEDYRVPTVAAAYKAAANA